MNEIEKKLPSIIGDKDLSALADSIADMVNEAKSHLVQTVNTTLVQTKMACLAEEALAIC